MSERTIPEILMEARDLLDDESKWVKGHFYTRGHEQHCARGAVYHVTGVCRAGQLNVPQMADGKATRATMYLDMAAEDRGYGGIMELNDYPRSTLSLVREMFDDAIRLAKEAEDG